MGSIIGQKIDKNGIGALRGQRHIPSKHLPKYPPPPHPRPRARAPLPWLNSDSFLPRPVIMIMSGIINTKFDRRLQPLTVDLSIITFCVQEPIVLIRVRSRTRASISLFGNIFLIFGHLSLRRNKTNCGSKHKEILTSFWEELKKTST